MKVSIFHGYGCAISKASTSILAKHLEGKTLEEALALSTEFQQVVSPETSTENEKEEFEAFAAAKDFPGAFAMCYFELGKVLLHF